MDRVRNVSKTVIVNTAVALVCGLSLSAGVVTETKSGKRAGRAVAESAADRGTPTEAPLHLYV